jgi:hypothetical protein
MQKLKILFAVLITAMLGFVVIHGDFRHGTFHFVGEVSADDNAHVKFQMSVRSNRECAAHCLGDADCNAIEICTEGMSCRLTIGSGQESPRNSSGVACQRYRLVRVFFKNSRICLCDFRAIDVALKFVYQQYNKHTHACFFSYNS